MQSGGRYTVLQGKLGLYFVVVVGQTVVAVNHSVCRDKWDVSDGWLVFWGHIALGLVRPHFLLLSHTVLPGIGKIKVQSGWNTARNPSGCFFFILFLIFLFAGAFFPRDKQQPTGPWLETLATSSSKPPHPRLENDALPQEERQSIRWTLWCHIDKQSVECCCLFSAMGSSSLRNLCACTVLTDAEIQSPAKCTHPLGSVTDPRRRGTMCWRGAALLDYFRKRAYRLFASRPWCLRALLLWEPLCRSLISADLFSCKRLYFKRDVAYFLTCHRKGKGGW